jgi:dolichyl-phosphate-mannose--protein O-mannosyl transferase
MADGVQHVFVYLLAICISSSENCLPLFVHLLIRLLALLLFSFLSSLCILDTISYLLNSWQRFFSHFVACLLILVIVSFDDTLLIFMDDFEGVNLQEEKLLR